MTQVYDILDKLRDKLMDNPNVFSVKFGDLDEIDLDKTEMYPLAHLDIAPNITFVDNVIEFSISLMVLDIVDITKKDDKTKPFYGNDNLVDVLNTQLGVVSDIVTSLQRGSLFDNQVQLVNEPTVEKLVDKYENMLAGWGASFTIRVPNTFSIC
jgi:hypothetical protein